MEFTVLLDAPAKPVTRIQIAKLGDYNDPRYGDFAIGADNVANWQKHLSKLPGGEALIDFEHRSERKPRDSEAAGWISGIELEGDKVMATARWTSKGKDAIEDERYRFLSPVFGPTQVEGETLDEALPSVALTNKPYLSSMPALMLASEERVSEAVEEELTRVLELAAANHVEITGAQQRMLDQIAAHNERADSRPPTMPNEALLKLLDLDDSADDARILEAVTALKATPATEPAKPSKKELRKLLEQEAAEGGLVLLDKAAVNQLQTQASAGAAAMKQLHQATFENAFTQALKDRKVTPAERDDLHKVYELDSALALKLLTDREPIMPDKPQGEPVIALDLDEPIDPERVAAAGIYPNSADLDRQIRKHMLDNKIPEAGYARLLDQVVSGEVIL